MSKSTVVCVLSSTLLQHSGDYRYAECPEPPDVADIPHYVGHPATRFLLDQAGAVYTPGLFGGLQPGQSFVVAQLRDPRKGQAFTTDAPNVGAGDLKWGLVIRIS